MSEPWDEYWGGKESSVSAVYDSIARFYRNRIIKPNLNAFLRKYFDAGSVVLHAGCGSGQVDADAAREIRIIPLDLSVPALRLYGSNIEMKGTPLVRGDISGLPFADSSLDGIYNLGVMEHFTEDEIGRILEEFGRVVRPGGAILLFWPPEFGLSVMFLKAVHFVLRLFGRKAKLHPDEVTRIRSRAHIGAIMHRSGLEIIEQSFGIRDLFTYYIIAARKPGGKAREAAGERSGFEFADYAACPACRAFPLGREASGSLSCPSCGASYLFVDGIYDFISAKKSD